MKYGGQYLGQIWLYTYNSQPAFLVQMMMGSGAFAGYVYYCSGTLSGITGTQSATWISEAKTKGKLLYKNAPL